MTDDTEATRVGTTTDQTGRIRREQQFRLTGTTDNVRICKIHTPKGERLELYNPDTDTYCRLDAMQIESLSWQDPAFFECLLEHPSDPPSDQRSESESAVTEWITLANEYAEAKVGRTSENERQELVIRSEPLHHESRVRAQHLVAIIDKDHTFFSNLLQDPYGPLTS